MAKNALRNFTKILLIGINVLVSCLFLLACLLPNISPSSWWMMGLLGLMVPYLVLVLILFLIGWLIIRPGLSLLSLLPLLAGWQQLSVMFAWHTDSAFKSEKADAAIRLVDWNVQSFNGMSQNRTLKKLAAGEAVASILKQEADIICLQEFNHAKNSDNILLFADKYPYHFFSHDYQGSRSGYQSGCIIFSRYPIIDTGRIPYPVAESLIYADIIRGKDTLRIFTTHLQSFKFQKSDYEDMEKIQNQEDENLAASRSLLRKMKLAFQRRSVQADMVRNTLRKSPYPTILCGDFNDVPNSYTYFHIRGGWQDAFLQKGFGIGRTFVSLAPTLRIDYILADRHFEVLQFDRMDENLSDHYMQVSDLVLKK